MYFVDLTFFFFKNKNRIRKESNGRAKKVPSPSTHVVYKSLGEMKDTPMSWKKTNDYPILSASPKATYTRLLVQIYQKFPQNWTTESRNPHEAKRKEDKEKETESEQYLVDDLEGGEWLSGEKSVKELIGTQRIRSFICNNNVSVGSFIFL